MKKTKKRPLSVAIIVDLMGSSLASPEEEIAQHTKNFQKLLPEYDLKISTPRCVMPDLSADLVIYDFGGMMPGTSLMEDNSRQIVRWAADHPSSLVIVPSTYTYGAYVKPEMEALGLTDIRNIVLDDGSLDNPIPSWFGK